MIWLSVFVSNVITFSTSAEYVRQTISLRLKHLKSFAALSTETVTCNADKLIVITEFQWGNTGNHIISFTHGVWLARKMNATLVVPTWMNDMLAPFNTTVLKRNYCYTLNTEIPKHITPHEVTSEESFFFFKLFHDPHYAPLLPPMNRETIADLSLHFLVVYASLWSSPQPHIRAASEWLITEHLQGNFRYTTVHKRQMEGGCNKILAHVTRPSVDFSPAELPMARPEWAGNLHREHPLCTMPVDFVLETQALLHRNGSSIFVAYDGAGEVESYSRHGAVFSSVLDQYSGGGSGKALRKFVDMFVAMHGDLFVLNPRSTFSWQIYLLRVALALQSVPVVRGNDLFMQKLPEELAIGNRTLWVSWTSVVDAYLDSRR